MGRCVLKNICRENDQLCKPHGVCRLSRTEIGYTCQCNPGFQLTANDTSCEDINECMTEANNCQQLCSNSEGSFACSCQTGYQMDPDDERKCIDFDECANDASNSCEQVCSNSPGSYHCSCREGFKEDERDPSKCIDLCSLISCSHECTNGKCQCPSGGSLAPDQSTCVFDIVTEVEDELTPIAEPEPKFCKEIPASFGVEISCSEKPVLNPGNPEKLFTVGTICRGRCARGFVNEGRLKMKCNSKGDWVGTKGTCRQVTCPPLKLGRDVEVFPEVCSLGDSLVRQKCKFSCPPGLELVGSRSARCRRDGEWKQHGGNPKCVARTTDAPAIMTTTTPLPHYKPTEPSTAVISTATTSNSTRETHIQPYIYCPPDVVRNLTADSASIHVRIPQPKTNVDWLNNVKSTPDWAKNLEAELPLGKALVTFQAQSPDSDASASCSFTIHIRDTISPRVYNCPEDFHVYLDEGQEDKQVIWEEPIFADNVKIKHVMASKMPGQRFGEGSHNVLYQATDEDGNQARCTFTIEVFNARNTPLRRRKWVVCRVGSTGRLVKIYVSKVPSGCWTLARYHF